MTREHPARPTGPDTAQRTRFRTRRAPHGTTRAPGSARPSRADAGVGRTAVAALCAVPGRLASAHGGVRTAMPGLCAVLGRYAVRGRPRVARGVGRTPWAGSLCAVPGRPGSGSAPGAVRTAA
ncbi:hypothetical protein ABZ624_43210, partial [Streptomyces sp. NPDC007205]